MIPKYIKFTENIIDFKKIRVIFYYNEKDIIPYFNKYNEIIKIRNDQDVFNSLNITKYNSDFNFKMLEKYSNKSVLFHCLEDSKISWIFFKYFIAYSKMSDFKNIQISISIPCELYSNTKTIEFRQKVNQIENQEQNDTDIFLHLEPNKIEGKTINLKLKNLKLGNYIIDTNYKSQFPKTNIS